jgi:segregation and condensation protein B
MSIQNSIEAMLFVSNRPLKIIKLAKLANCSLHEATQALGYLALRYKDSGVHLKIANGSAQLVTNPEYEEAVKPLQKKVAKRKITSAAIEVLAIIASKGEATATQVSKYRGSNSDSIIAGLLKKGLLAKFVLPTRTNRKKNVYRITDKFRMMAGISGIEEMKAQVALLTDDDDDELEEASLDLFDGDVGNQSS